MLAVAGGEANERIVERLETSKATVPKWRAGTRTRAMAGLSDQARSGRPGRSIMRGSCRSRGDAAEEVRGDTLVDQAARAASGNREQDGGDRVERVRGAAMAQRSTDPELVAKVTDMVGLYLDPPA